jgi:hypothetical protein
MRGGLAEPTSGENVRLPQILNPAWIVVTQSCLRLKAAGDYSVSLALWVRIWRVKQIWFVPYRR